MITQARRGRIEDYAELRSWGLTEAQAASRLGTTTRTAERYEAHLRQREGAVATSHQIEMAAAPDRAVGTVDAGGPLGPKYVDTFGDTDMTEQERRRAARYVRKWARRQRWTKKASRPLAREMRFELGLARDPQARPAKAPLGTISLSTGYQRPGVV